MKGFECSRSVLECFGVFLNVWQVFVMFGGVVSVWSVVEVFLDVWQGFWVLGGCLKLFKVV